jgi:hypothetical protein
LACARAFFARRTQYPGSSNCGAMCMKLPQRLNPVLTFEDFERS